MVRAFIAVQLSPPIQRALEQFIRPLQGELQSLPIRWVPVKNIHLTFKFLGDIPEESVGAITRALRDVAGSASPFESHIQGLGCFPHLHRPRVFWVGLQGAGDLINDLHRKVDATLTQLDFEPEKRAFHPHLTLGRFKAAPRDDQLRTLTQRIKDHEQTEVGVFWVDCIHLMRSDLTPAGAIYSSLGSARLRAE